MENNKIETEKLDKQINVRMSENTKMWFEDLEGANQNEKFSKMIEIVKNYQASIGKLEIDSHIKNLENNMKAIVDTVALVNSSAKMYAEDINNKCNRTLQEEMKTLFKRDVAIEELENNYKNALNELTVKTNELEKTNAQLTEEIGGATEKLEEAKNLSEKYEKKISVNDTKIAELTVSNNNLLSEQINKNKEIDSIKKEFEDKLKDANKDIQNLEKDKLLLENNNNMLQVQFQEIKEELKVLRLEQKQDINHLNAEYKQEINTINTQYKKEIEVLENTKSEQIKILENKLDKQEKEYQLKQEQLLKQVNELEKDAIKKENKIEELEKESIQKNTIITELETEIKKLALTIEDQEAIEEMKSKTKK